MIALPLLPERSLQGSLVMDINPDQGETVGWPRFVETVSTAWHALPAATRRQTAIFTLNYGEAGAVDVLGEKLGLPSAYSGHNGFAEWGPPPASDRNALVVGYLRVWHAGLFFSGCRRLATVDNRVGLDNDEQGVLVLFCRPQAPWASLWPRLTHYG